MPIAPSAVILKLFDEVAEPMKKTGLIVILITAVAVVSVQNVQPVFVAVLFWNLEMPFTLVIVGAMLIGMLTGGLIADRREMRTKEEGKK